MMDRHRRLEELSSMLDRGLLTETVAAGIDLIGLLS